MACELQRDTPTLSSKTVIRKALSFPMSRSTVSLSGNLNNSTSSKCVNEFRSYLCGKVLTSSCHELLVTTLLHSNISLKNKDCKSNLTKFVCVKASPLSVTIRNDA